ncbi:MAG: beta-lactamase family protein [bacterium]|nr:MAG: beta-lactamase family protein [bacterium]
MKYAFMVTGKSGNMVLMILVLSLTCVVLPGMICAMQPAGAVSDFTAERDTLAPVLEGLPDRIMAAVTEDRLISVALAVVLDRDIIFCRAFGYADLERESAATTRTIYPIASITKVFTAMMLARLVEQGVIGLEDPVQKYLPEYRPASPFEGTLPTTLRQLAAHTSGLPKDAPVNFWCNFAGFSWVVTGGSSPMTWFVDCDSLLASLGDLELVHPPDIYAHYSNLNMQILGLALERAAGEPFVEYVENEILAPLGMNNSGFMLDEERRKLLATGYMCTGPTVTPLKAPEYELGCALYSGGLFTTVEDLARFVISQLEDRQTGTSSVLEVGTLRRMRTPQSIHRPSIHGCYGLGWGIVQIGPYDAIEHNGSLIGYHAHVSAIPELRLGIVALSNSKNSMWRPQACKDLARAILVDLSDALVEKSKDDVFDPATMEFTTFAGRYALPGDVARLEINATTDGLLVTLKDVPDFSEEFLPVGPYAFCFAADPGRKPMLFFKQNETSGIDRVTFLSHTFKRMATDW